MSTVYDTATLLGVARAVYPNQRFLTRMLYRDVHLSASETIDLDKVDGTRKLAPFVTPFVAGQLSKRSGISTSKISAPYVKPKDVVDPARQLKRLAGELPGGTMTPAQRRDAIMADILREHREKVERRIEWMAAQSVLSGKIIVEGENYPKSEIDFGRDNTLTKVLAGSAKWGQTGVDPISDLELWASSTALKGNVTDIIMGKGAWSEIVAQAKTNGTRLSAILDKTKRENATSLKLDPSFAGEDVDYKGQLSDGCDVYVYAETFENDNDVEETYIGANDVVLIANNTFRGVQGYGGVLSMGTWLESQFHPRHWVGQEVELEFIESSSAPVMIPREVNASMCITVK